MNYRQLILAFIRYDKNYGDLVVYLINLSKEYFADFRLGVPRPGKYVKMLDTDGKEFGGNGHNWVTDYETVQHSAFHHPHSFTTKLLPLHGMLFRWVDGKK
jgi:1,4-alpha-glucan branching enzyme